jgi:hypothetical protein
MNKKILVLPLILLALGCRDRYEGQAGAASSPSPGASPYAMESPSAYASPGLTAGGTTVSVEVVSVDSAGRTINVRESGVTGATGGQGQRVTVSSTAADMLADLRAGDRITITCDATGTTGTGATGTGGAAAGATGAGTTGTGTLASCTNVTMITRSGGATGR